MEEVVDGELEVAVMVSMDQEDGGREGTERAAGWLLWLARRVGSGSSINEIVSQ